MRRSSRFRPSGRCITSSRATRSVEAYLVPIRKSLEEALRISTIENARLTFEEKIKGSIEPGKLADFVVLDENILTVEPKRIERMKVVATVVGGKTVFSR